MILMTHCQLLKTESVGAGWANEYRAPRNYAEKGFSKYLKKNLHQGLSVHKIRLVWAAQGSKPGLCRDRSAA